MDENNPLDPQASQPNQNPAPQPVVPTDQFFQPSVNPAATPVPVNPTVEPTVVTPQAAQQPIEQPVTVQPVQNTTQPEASAQSPQPIVGDQAPQPQQPPAPVAEHQTDTLGIISIVLFFVFSLAGLIVGIIGIRRAKKRGYSATLSIIGTVLNGVAMSFVALILPLLVITTFSGIQQKGRDTERQTDIRAIHGQLEAYYAQKGAYPLLTELNDSSWRQTNMSSLGTTALTDPRNETDSALKSAPTAGAYSYQVYEVDNITPCTIAAKCAKYTLTATLDGSINGSNTYIKTSLN